MSSQVFGTNLLSAFHIRTFSKNTGSNGAPLAIPQRTTTILPVLHAISEYPDGDDLPSELSSFFNALDRREQTAVLESRKIWGFLGQGAVSVKLFTHGSGWLVLSGTVGTEEDLAYKICIVQAGKGEVKFVVGRRGEGSGVITLREQGGHDFGEHGEEITDQDKKNNICGWVRKNISHLGQMVIEGLQTLGELSADLDYRDTLFLRISGIYAAFELADDTLKGRIRESLVRYRDNEEKDYRRGLLVALSRALEMSFGGICTLVLTASEKGLLHQVIGSYNERGRCIRLARAGEKNLIGLLYPGDARNGSMILELRKSVARGNLESISFEYAAAGP